MEDKNKELLLQKIDELVTLIKESSDYKRYIEIKEQMKKNKDIMSLISKIKKGEQTIINKEYRKEDISKDKEELNKLKQELDSYPIYQEYNYLQEDLNNMFQNIRMIIETSIKNNS